MCNTTLFKANEQHFYKHLRSMSTLCIGKERVRKTGRTLDFVYAHDGDWYFCCTCGLHASNTPGGRSAPWNPPCGNWPKGLATTTTPPTTELWRSTQMRQRFRGHRQQLVVVIQKCLLLSKGSAPGYPHQSPAMKMNLMLNRTGRRTLGISGHAARPRSKKQPVQQIQLTPLPV